MGLSFFKRDSGGGLIIASYHPKKYRTWVWFVGLNKIPEEMRHRWFRYNNLSNEMNGRYILVLFKKWDFQLQTQSYHKQAA